MAIGIGLICLIGVLLGAGIFGLGLLQLFIGGASDAGMIAATPGMSQMLVQGPEAISFIVMFVGLALMTVSFIVYFVMRQRRKKMEAD